MKKLIFTLTILFISLINTIFAQNANNKIVKIPDANFEQVLIDLKIDSDGIVDGQILIGDAILIDSLNVLSKGITDLTGIEAFVNLTYLNCSNNDLTSLDVSKNTALTGLYCWDNRLRSLDVSKNTALTDLWCGANGLTSLDVSKNTALTGLYCWDNRLRSLDVSQNTALTDLECGANRLTSLDVSKSTALTYLECNNNQLTSLDVSKNTALTDLECGNNQLTSLDVSNTALFQLHCSNNKLKNIDIRNGNNYKMSYFNAQDNNLLSCISVDDETADHSHWKVDEGVVFSNDCGDSTGSIAPK